MAWRQYEGCRHRSHRSCHQLWRSQKTRDVAACPSMAATDQTAGRTRPPFTAIVEAANGIDLAVKHRNPVPAAVSRHARHLIPRSGPWVVHLRRAQSTDCRPEHRPGDAQGLSAVPSAQLPAATHEGCRGEGGGGGVGEGGGGGGCPPWTPARPGLSSAGSPRPSPQNARASSPRAARLRAAQWPPTTAPSTGIRPPRA
eukprot:scaffold114740_cov63-Phaeocystis_antarctica.AAC.1